MQHAPIRIGTRGSPLALVQAHDVRARLMAAHALHEAAFEICIIKTSGDRIQDRPLSEVGGKGLFTKELEDALLAGAVDLAVHSMKDVATVVSDGLEIAAYLPRQDVRDAFISSVYPSLAALPPRAVVGTSSLRRQAQIMRLRPDLEVIGFRGNVETRLKKLEQGIAAATLLAVAGLNRLGQAHRITRPIGIDEMLPAVAQGAVGVEIVSENARVAKLVAALDNSVTRTCVVAERAFLRILDGSCRTPIAGLATLAGGAMTFRGMILTPDGRQMHETVRTGSAGQSVAMAEDAARELLGRAGPDFFRPLSS